MRLRLAIPLLSLMLLVSACSAESGASTTSSTVVVAAKTTSTTEQPIAITTEQPAAPLTTTTEQPPEPVVDETAACKLEDASGNGATNLGFSRPQYRLAPTGSITAAVLFVDFSDAPATSSVEDTYALISPEAPEMFTALSNGRLNLDLRPHLVWLRASQPTSAYSYSTYFSHQAYIQEAVDLADDEIDFTDVDFLVIITNPKATAFSFGPTFVGHPFFGGIEAERDSDQPVTIYNAITSGADLTYWGYPWLNHEMGHSLGLVDLYSYDPAAQFKFTGDFSLMSNIEGGAPEFLAYERWILGWIDDDQVICQTTSDQSTVLSAIESDGGTKAVVVKVGDTKSVVIESRRPLGYDSEIVQAGALVYTVDTSIDSGLGPIVVYPQDSNLRVNSTLDAGDSVTVEGVTVTVLEATEAGDTVQVTIDG